MFDKDADALKVEPKKPTLASWGAEIPIVSDNGKANLNPLFL
ncbi:hypothetical protein [Laspinema palackyanum]